MFSVGSNKNVNILVQVDQWGHKKITRYFVKKNSIEVMESHDITPKNASGTPESLFDCARWATENYPAEHTALILWNHGSGILDPNIWGRLLSEGRDSLYVFNPATCLFELDREALGRGIAFNETFQTYISNEELKETLHRISTELLGRKKIDVLGMDACHMAMIEIGAQVKDSVKCMVASEEAEPGQGWNYEYLLEVFKKESPSPQTLAKAIVDSYHREYHNVYGDYTQSAFNLEGIEVLEKNVGNVATVLKELLCTSEKTKRSTHVLRRIRLNNQYTTTFYNHNYIDLRHFYTSIREHLIERNDEGNVAADSTELENLLVEGLSLIDECVVANAVGPSLSHIGGMAIYFPTRQIHSSYLKTTFAKTTPWLDFLIEYLRRAGRTTQNQNSLDYTEDNDELSALVPFFVDQINPMR